MISRYIIYSEIFQIFITNKFITFISFINIITRNRHYLGTITF